MSRRVIHLDETHSTSSYLNELASTQPLDEGSVVWAEFQTAGRGQRGNSWESIAGKNLSFSILLHPVFVEVNKSFILSQIASLAVKSVLDNYVSGIKIKWPNDIYWHDKKICGILVENNLTGTAITRTVIGIGINVNQEAFYSDAPNPVSLTQISGQVYDRQVVLEAVISKLLSLYYEAKVNPEAIVAEYMRSLYRGTGYYPYRDNQGDFFAKIAGIEPSGHLVLQLQNGGERHYAFKEVRFLHI